MAINRFFVIFFLLILCKVQVQSQETRMAISIESIDIPFVIKVGTYEQLVMCLGSPLDRFVSHINPINPKYIKNNIHVPPQSTIECVVLVYDAFEYIMVGDSVQLVFIDVKNSKYPIFIDGICLSRRTKQKDLMLRMESKGYWLKSDYECWIGAIDSHYNTVEPVSVYHFDFKEDPYSNVLITFKKRRYRWQSERIWWIEIPLMRKCGIIH